MDMVDSNLNDEIIFTVDPDDDTYSSALAKTEKIGLYRASIINFRQKLQSKPDTYLKEKTEPVQTNLFLTVKFFKYIKLIFYCWLL